MGFRVRLRAEREGHEFRSDNGNAILDLTPSSPLADPAETDRSLRAWTGVVEPASSSGWPTGS